MPSFPWGVESSKIFKKNKEFSKFQKSRKSLPKVSKRVLNLFWGKFFKKTSQCSMEARVLENFRQKMSKFQKCPKSFPKASKRVLNMFWGEFFGKFFAQCSMDVRVFETFQKKSKNFQNSNQKRQNRSQKNPKVFRTSFGANFSRKFAQFSMGGRVFENFQKKQRIFKVPKKPKIVTKSVQTCFELVLGQIFPKKTVIPVFHRVFENFQKNQKNVKIPKMPKIVPKSIQTCFEHVLGRIFRKIFCPVFHGCSSLRNFSKKLKKFSKFQPKTHKTVPTRIQKCFEQVLGQIFRKIFAQFSMGGRVFENFQKKKQRIFKVPKKPKIVTKSVQTCFELVLGQIFPKKTVIPVFHGGSSLRKFSKKSKKFQNSKNAPNRSQKHPNVF